MRVFFALVTSLLLALTCASAPNCIDMRGKCVGSRDIGPECPSSEVHTGLGCPRGSQCCLVLGSLCAANEGECMLQQDCSGGRFIGTDFPCGQGTVCCLSKLPQTYLDTGEPQETSSTARGSGKNVPKQVGLEQTIQALIEAQQFSDSADPFLSIGFPIAAYVLIVAMLFFVTGDVTGISSIVPRPKKKPRRT